MFGLFGFYPASGAVVREHKGSFMAVWFTADTHFGHANIIRHCNRPFGSVQEMDDALIASINAHVAPADTLYHLGDFAFRGNDPAVYRGRIHCRSVVLILGNHDPQTLAGAVKPEFAALFSGVHSLLRINAVVAGQPRRIMLCHYAMRVWDKVHYGSWHLFGHSHGTLADDPNLRSWDVGVDANGYAPVSLAAVAEIMARKQFVPVDAHRPPGDQPRPESPTPSGTGQALARPADALTPLLLSPPVDLSARPSAG